MLFKKTPGEIENGEYILLCSLVSNVETSMIIEMLQSNNIEPYIQTTGSGPYLKTIFGFNNVNPANIYVYKDDFEKAKEIFEFFKQPVQEDETV